MSLVTDEIRATCSEVADNQKKIYDLGYKQGRASVKHITFSISLEWDTVFFCAVSGMTWRTFLESPLSENDYYSFYIEDDLIYFDWKVINARLDDEIIDNGYYFCYYTIGSGTEMFYIDSYSSFAESYNSDLNRGRFYIDNNDYVRTTSGKMLLYSEGVNTPYPVESHLSYYSECSWWWTPDTDVIVFTVSSSYTCTAKRGYTWREFCNNADYSNCWYVVNGDIITHEWEGVTMQLDGVNVKPDDVIIEGTNYELAYQ